MVLPQSATGPKQYLLPWVAALIKANFPQRFSSVVIIMPSHLEVMPAEHGGLSAVPGKHSSCQDTLAPEGTNTSENLAFEAFGMLQLCV